QRVEGAVVGFAKAAEGEDLEEVGGDARDHEADTDGEGAVGQWERRDQVLRPLAGREADGGVFESGVGRHDASAGGGSSVGRRWPAGLSAQRRSGSPARGYQRGRANSGSPVPASDR